MLKKKRHRAQRKLRKRWKNRHRAQRKLRKSGKKRHSAQRKLRKLRTILRNAHLYTCSNMLKRVTRWCGPSPRHCARAKQFLSKKCRSDGEPVATLRSIWPARDLNLRPPAPETNALPLDQQATSLVCHLIYFQLFFTSNKLCGCNSFFSKFLKLYWWLE